MPGTWWVLSKRQPNFLFHCQWWYIKKHEWSGRNSNPCLKIFFIDYAIIVVPFPPLYSLPPCIPPPTSIPRPSFLSVSCIHKFLGVSISILFLTSPCLVCTYHICFLFPVSFLPFSPLHLPPGNPPCELYFCESVPVFVFLDSVIDSCEFVVILLFVFLITFFFLDKSL